MNEWMMNETVTSGSGFCIQPWFDFSRISLRWLLDSFWKTFLLSHIYTQLILSRVVVPPTVQEGHLCFLKEKQTGNHHSIRIRDRRLRSAINCDLKHNILDLPILRMLVTRVRKVDSWYWYHEATVLSVVPGDQQLIRFRHVELLRWLFASQIQLALDTIGAFGHQMPCNSLTQLLERQCNRRKRNKNIRFQYQVSLHGS